jgi:hypothetical protein
MNNKFAAGECAFHAPRVSVAADATRLVRRIDLVPTLP